MSVDTEPRTDSAPPSAPAEAATVPEGLPVHARVIPPPATAVPAPPKSPLAALVLSVFPGIGQIYNGQPAKALVFFVAFTGAIFLTAEGNPMPFALMIPFVYFYGMVDAWRSAALINARGQGLPPEDEGESPAWGWTLVGLGLLFLLNNLGWLRLAALGRYWPVLLIVAGGAFVWSSLQRRG